MRRLALAVGAVIAAGCGGPPWYMGQPLGGPAIPASSADQAPSALRREIATERRACRAVLELRALERLERRGLRVDEAARLRALRDARRAALLARDAAARTAAAPGCAGAPAAGDWVFAGASLGGRWDALPPVERQRLARGPLGSTIATALIDESPSSPDALHAAALIDVERGHPAGAEQRLADLVHHSRDRLDARRRVATFWDQRGDVPRACAAWARAARASGDRHDPAWRRVLACVERDPRLGDAAEVRRHVEAP